MNNLHKRLPRRNKCWAIVAALSTGLAGGCSLPNDVHLVRNGAEVRLDAAQAEDFASRTGAAKEILSAILGKEVSDLSASLTPRESASILRTGYAYIDVQCDTYFKALLRIQRDVGATSTELAILGTAATAILALTGAGAVAAGVTAAATGAAIATTDNVGSALLFALDSAATHGLTVRAMNAYANSEAARPENVHTYGDAFAIISGYALQCSPPKIESLVKEAVQKAVPGDANEFQERGTGAAVDSILSNLQERTKLPKLTVDEATLLYLLFVTDDDAALTPGSDIMRGIQSRLASLNKELSDKIFDPSKDPLEVILSNEAKNQLTEGLRYVGIVDPAIPAAAEKQKREIAASQGAPAEVVPQVPSDLAPSRMVPDIQILRFQ